MGELAMSAGAEETLEEKLAGRPPWQTEAVLAGLTV